MVLYLVLFVKLGRGVVKETIGHSSASAGAIGDAATSPTGEAGRAAKPTGLIYL